MIPRDDAKGPFVRWLDYGIYEGWRPQSFDTLKEALSEQDHVFGSRYVITRIVDFEARDKTDA